MVSFFSLLASSLYISFVFSDVHPFQDDDEYKLSEYGAYPKQRFFSDLEVIAPVPNIITPPQDGVSPEQLITWSPHGDEDQVPAHGPQLLDTQTLSVVYQGPTFDEDNFGISMQSCNGSDHLVWWAGTNIDGRAAGRYYILNSTYHIIHNISSINLKLADAHDIHITPNCHAIITVNEPKPHELEDFSLHDNSWLLESYFQEIDLANNELVFQWRASDHIDIHDSLWNPQVSGWESDWQGWEKQNAWDFFHINSVEKDWKGNYLISARHMCAVYYIDGRTGHVKWQLGGQKNDFRDLNDGYATDFAWQHHARWADEELTTISVFDDRKCRYIASDDPISRGALIKLDFGDMTARLEHNYRAPSSIAAFRKGSMQVLPNRNVLLGFGNEPAWTEYAENGTIVWDVRMGPVMAGYDRETADNYRSLKVDWHGRPWWGPKIAAGPEIVHPFEMMDFAGIAERDWEGRENDTVYFSWNGATEVKRWMVFAAEYPLELDGMGSLIGMVNKTGFEEGFYLGGNMTRFSRAVALDQGGKMLGATPILDMLDGNTYPSMQDLLLRADTDDQHVENLDLATVLDEADNLALLKKEWDAVRFKDQRQRWSIAWGLLFFIVILSAGGWLCWRQLKQAFEDKYTPERSILLEGGQMARDARPLGEDKVAHKIKDDARWRGLLGTWKL